MDKIYIREIEDISIINTKNINEKVLIDIFLNNQDATIYVEEFGKIEGIITLGNLRRYILEGEELVNRNFSKVSTDSKVEIENVFNKSRNIMSVPLINEYGEIVKEFYRVRANNGKRNIQKKVFLEICREAILLDPSYNQLVFVVDDELKYSALYDNHRIKVISENDIEELIGYLKLKDILVYDMIYSSYWVRKIFYDKFNIKNIIRYDGSNNRFSARHISERGKLFDNIAISSESVKIKSILSNRNIISIKFDKLKWNIVEECFEYIGYYDGNVECVFMMACFLKRPCIIINGKMVPIIADEYVNLEAMFHVAAIDIISNIIPRFRNNNIRYLFIKYPDDEYSLLEEKLNADIKKRKPYQEREHEELARFVGISDISVSKELFASAYEIFKNGFRQLGDYKGKYYNFNNGERYTNGNPSEYGKTLYLFGPCIIEGLLVTDENTIGSYLREFVPDNYYIKNLGRRFETEHFIMRSNMYKSGDIALIMLYNDKVCEQIERIHSVIDAYKRVDNLSEHVLEQLSHCDKVVTKELALEVYNILESEQIFAEDKEKSTNKEKFVEFGIKDNRIYIPDEMKEWLDEVKKFKVPGCEKAGAIVMNCNPFTLGHRYLIETASSQVDVLYIFVLEEDKSFFKFEDRIELVRRGTAYLTNVVVLPSGKYVISTETLPGYFDKEKNPYAKCDATEDLEIFSGVIAKELDIKVRFAGEEPKDPFTRKYNEYMRNLLPKRGVEFVEIPRKQCGDKVISASLVRKYLKEKNFVEIEKIVPATTLKYLKKNYM